MILDHVDIVGCHFEHQDSIFALTDEKRMYFGMIGVQNSELNGVTFERIGIATSQDMVNAILSSGI
jgi:hypothetical protein